MSRKDPFGIVGFTSSNPSASFCTVAAAATVHEAVRINKWFCKWQDRRRGKTVQRTCEVSVWEGGLVAVSYRLKLVGFFGSEIGNENNRNMKVLISKVMVMIGGKPSTASQTLANEMQLLKDDAEDYFNVIGVSWLALCVQLPLRTDDRATSGDNLNCMLSPVLEANMTSILSISQV